MADSIAFSVREALQGHLAGFIRNCGFKNIVVEELVRDLTSLLVAYREEGVPLFPQVFVLSDEGLTALLAPATDRVRIGSVVESAGIAGVVMKVCAPLATGGWAIYIAVGSDSEAVYGLFRSQHMSHSVPASALLCDLGEGSAILAQNTGHLVVELANSANKKFVARFTATDSKAGSVNDCVSRFCESMTSEVVGEIDGFHLYLTRFIEGLLQRSHGTLLAVYSQSLGDECPEAFSDGVWLDKPLDLFEHHRRVVSEREAQSLAWLQSSEVLVEGMVNSDGVVVFSTRGQILGYRVFLKPTDEEKQTAPVKGGGRRRTYALMRGRLGERQRAALFRSQDGDTECDCWESGDV